MMEVDAKEDFRERTLRTVKKGLGKLWRRHSVTITEYDPSYKVTYLGNVLTGWAKDEACVHKPLNTLWRNYQTTSKPDTQMKITVTQSGLKAVTKEHGLTEYWSHRISYCAAIASLPKVFCWVYRHEGRKLKPELRCHAVLCSKDSISRRMASELQRRLVQALIEFKRDKISRQNARLSLANCVYDNPSLPRRKILLSTGTHNYKPPLERSKSAPKLMVIEENIEEEDEAVVTNKYDRLPFLKQCPQVKNCIRPDKFLKRHSSETRFGSNKLGGLLQFNLSKSVASNDLEIKCSEDTNSASGEFKASGKNKISDSHKHISTNEKEYCDPVNSNLDVVVCESLIKSQNNGSKEVKEAVAVKRVLEEIDDEDTTSGASNEVDDKPFASDEHELVPIEELTDFDEGSITDEGESEEDFEKRMREMNKWNLLLLKQRSNSIASDLSFSSLEDCSLEEPLACILERKDEGLEVYDPSELSCVSDYTPKNDYWDGKPDESSAGNKISGMNRGSFNQNISCTAIHTDKKAKTDDSNKNVVKVENKTLKIEDPMDDYSPKNISKPETVQIGTDSPIYQTSDLLNYQTATSKSTALEVNPPSYEEAVRNEQKHVASEPSTKFNSLVRDRKRLFERDQRKEDVCFKQSEGSGIIVSQQDSDTSGDAKRSFFIKNRRKIFEQVSDSGCKNGFLTTSNFKRKMSEESTKSSDQEDTGSSIDVKHGQNAAADSFLSVDEESTPSLQSISSGNSDSSASSHTVLKSGGESNSIGYDLHSISSSEDSDESGFVESLTADDPLNKNDDKSRDLPHHQLMKSCILTSKTRCVEV